MIIEYNGQSYEFDELDLDLDEAEKIQAYVGRSLGDWSNGLMTCEVKALMALWWIMRKRAGENPGPLASKPPGFKPVKLFAAYTDAFSAEVDRQAAELEAKEAKEADPTRPPADSSPASAGTTTTPASAAPLLSPPG